MSTTSQAPADPINRRYDFVLLFDVINGNPNGDPDAGNAPRVDPETGRGLVSDVCIKRKIRNFVTVAKTGADGAPEDGYDIYVKERAILNQQHARAYEALKLDLPVKAARKPKAGRKSNEAGDDAKPGASRPLSEDAPPQSSQESTNRARDWMCKTFFDIRMFGAVMTTGVDAGQVRGPVQITFARSVDTIVSLEQAITRMAVTTVGESENQGGGNRTMGRKEIVPYGLYVGYGFISPQLARQTGFSAEDLKLLRKGLGRMFDFDRSSSRGLMATRGLWAFEHESPLGNAPSHRLFERIRIARKDDTRPPRAFDDYVVTVDSDSLPSGVQLQDWLD
jgi:CRISPR-associated protein Csd2